MGSNVKFLMALNGPFWRRAELGPEIAHRRAGVSDVARHRRPARARAKRWSRSPAAPPPTRAASGRPTARTENYLAELQKIYKGIRPSFVRARFMDWPSDPWVKASYSFPAPGQVTAQGPTLRQGIGRLHFAGEHTSYAFMGYMEGALEFGRRRRAPHRGQGRRRQGKRGVNRQNTRGSSSG